MTKPSNGPAGDKSATLEALHARASALVEEEKYEEAEPVLRKRVALAKVQMGAAHPIFAIALYDLAQVLLVCGKYPEAESLLRRATSLLEKKPGMDDPSYGQALHALASVLSVRNKLQEAEQLLRGVLERQEKALGREHVALPSTLLALALALGQQRQHVEAERFATRALDIMVVAHGETHPETAATLGVLAQIQHSLGRPHAAETAQRALAILETIDPRQHPLIAAVEPTLRAIVGGDLASDGPDTETDALGQAFEALQAGAIEHAIGLLRPLVQNARAQGLAPLEATASNLLGQALFATGQRDEAQFHVQRSLDLAEEAGEDDHAKQFREVLQTMTSQSKLFQALEVASAELHQGHAQAAMHLLDKLIDEAHPSGAGIVETSAWALRGYALQALGQDKRAEEALHKALALAEQLGDSRTANEVRQVLARR